MFALELNYFQAAHNIEIGEFTAYASYEWGKRQVDYSFIGINLKIFFPLLFLHPFVTAGYGYYTADIFNIDKSTDKGYNLGLGFELYFGKKVSILAEGKYNQVDLEFDIEKRELKIGDFTLSGGLNLYF